MTRKNFNEFCIFVFCIAALSQFIDGYKDSKTSDCLVIEEHDALKFSEYSCGCKLGAVLK